MTTTTQLSPSSVGITMDFMRRTAPELARDIVCQLDGAANLAKSYGLTDMQWTVLKVWPAFKLMVQNANEELGGSAGTIERARRRAALAISEGGVLDLAAISGDPKVAPKDRIAAAALLTEIGAVSAKQAIAAAASGTAFGGALIQIFLPTTGQVSAIAPAPVEAGLPDVIEGEFTQVEQTV